MNGPLDIVKLFARKPGGNLFRCHKFSARHTNAVSDIFFIRVFPAIHKFGNCGIFVQLLIEINWKYLTDESISMQN